MKHDKSLKHEQRGLVLFAVVTSLGILLFNATFRATLSSSSTTYLNWVVILCYFVLGFEVVTKCKANELKASSLIYIFVPLLILGYLVIGSKFGGAISDHMLLSLVPPLFVAFLTLDTYDRLKVVLKIWADVFIVVIALVALCAAFDFISNYSITKFLASYYSTPAILQMRIDEPNRIISILGHPLFTSEVAVICSALCCLRLRILNDGKWVNIKLVLCLFVASATGSKIGVVVILGFLLLINLNNRRIKYVFGSFVALYILYIVGVFDVILSRFIVGLNSGDLTTGRSVRLVELQAAGLLDFNFFTGHSESLSERYIIALEYPFLRFSYKYGICFTLILYSFIFVYPVSKMIRRKHYFLLIIFLGVFVDINTFSSIASTGDGMLLYCMFLFLAVNTCNFIIPNANSLRDTTSIALDAKTTRANSLSTDCSRIHTERQLKCR